MTITTQRLNIHQFTKEEYDALMGASNLCLDLLNTYNENDVLMSPNTGEVIEISELLRVRGVLDFLIENRVVEVNP